MTYQLCQLIRNAPLAADEDAGWVQLLIFVIVAVIYGLAGLARARAQKARKTSTADDDSQPSTQRPAISQRAPFSEPAQHPTPTRQRTAFTEPPSKQRPLRTPPRTKSAPEKSDLPDVRLLQRKATVPKAKLGSPSQPTAQALDLSDTAALQRAIIHYEVLGPCLALRTEATQHPS